MLAFAQAQPVAHFDMSLTANGQITESSTQTHYHVASQLPAFTVDAPDGQALRFDGYSNYVKAGLPASSFNDETLTVSVVLAAESYPMMRVEDAELTPTFATVCGNLDETAKKGFALKLSSQGDICFSFGSALGSIFDITATKKLPLGQWNVVTAVLAKASNACTIYLNGEVVATGRMGRSAIAHADGDFNIGKDGGELKWGPFLINTFCGLIDDIAVYNEALSADELKTKSEALAAEKPNFNYPATRYAESLWRPQFHGMPSGSWTNETHGMTYSNGRWHVFFQKNANGPYMARLNWGHISSENLCNWQEEPIAIAPDASYDIKGCWSGCVYEDEGSTNILYTAVDNARAVIAQAKAADATLVDWQKQGIVINGRPQGLSDDFRDPYFFTANGQKYVIVGTSKNGLGACTLHKYQNGSWTNDGTIFFQGTTASLHGMFWEMPNVTPMGDGKFLFTCTPLGTGAGVRTLCWVGTIGADGRFTPDASGMQYLEMGGISREGYGLLSPTIYQKDGRTVLLGIVPDKLPTEENFKMGWAHNYSLPREISLAPDGSLVQRPCSELASMRSQSSMFNLQSSILGTQSLAPVSGRHIELLGEFTVANGGTCGFNFLKSGGKQASLTYDTDKGTLTLDITSLSRFVNDAGVYNGLYSTVLPKRINAGETLKMHVFIDGSVVDIFINDTWAYSVRIFSTDDAQTEAEAFATTQMQASLKAWTLNAEQASAIKAITSESNMFKADNRAYDLQGRALQTPTQRGIYIQNGRKYVAR